MIKTGSLANTETNISTTHVPIMNKGFLLLDKMFTSHGWHKTRNDMNCICFTRFGFETEYFEIKLDEKTIYVSVPIKNSIFQYSTTFTDYFSASEYVEQRFKDLLD